jgi:hypothetical protein
MISRGKAQKQASRTARLSAALRENLKRRKAQARGRAENRPADAQPVVMEKAVPSAPDFRRNPGCD